MTWRDVATIDQAVLAHPWLRVAVEGIQLVLAAHDGRWYAVEDRCSHAGCPLSEEATLEGSTIVCNCHGSEFDLATGEVRRGPADHPIRTIPTLAQGDRVEVDL